MLAQDILPQLKKVRSTKKGWVAQCPAHEDSHPSLSITEKDGKVLLHCFKGCSYRNIMAKLGVDAIPSTNGYRKIVAVYQYKNEVGEVLYENVRFEPKRFLQRHYGPGGREIWSLEGVRRVPYRLPQLMELTGDDAVIMAEGERDADRLVEEGFKATNHKNWKPEFNYLVKGRDVVIIQDHDEAGVAQAERVAATIAPDAAEIKIIDLFADEPLPVKHGKDVSDYLRIHSREHLLQLIRGWPVCEAIIQPDKSVKGTGFSVARLTDVQAKESVWLWKPFIPLGEFTKGEILRRN